MAQRKLSCHSTHLSPSPTIHSSRHHHHHHPPALSPSPHPTLAVPHEPTSSKFLNLPSYMAYFKFCPVFTSVFLFAIASPEFRPYNTRVDDVLQMVNNTFIYQLRKLVKTYQNLCIIQYDLIKYSWILNTSQCITHSKPLALRPYLSTAYHIYMRNPPSSRYPQNLCPSTKRGSHHAAQFWDVIFALIGNTDAQGQKRERHFWPWEVWLFAANLLSVEGNLCTTAAAFNKM